MVWFFCSSTAPQDLNLTLVPFFLQLLRPPVPCPRDRTLLYLSFPWVKVSCAIARASLKQFLLSGCSLHAALKSPSPLFCAHSLYAFWKQWAVYWYTGTPVSLLMRTLVAVVRVNFKNIRIL